MALIDRVREFVGAARSDVVMAAPFVKERVLEELLTGVMLDCSVTCVTRWRPEEIVLGVSDLDVFEACQKRHNARLFLRHDLHAKYFRADGECLIGSANLTGTALGMVSPCNFELLIQVSREHQDLARFEEKLLAGSIVATVQIRDEVERAVEKLKENRPEELLSLLTVSDGASRTSAFPQWLPNCTVPQQLFAVYEGDRSRLTAPTYQDALEDLDMFDLPADLDATEFRSVIAARLIQHPIIGTLLQDMTRSWIGENEVRVRLQRPEWREGQREEEVEVLWSWISLFFPGRFRRIEERGWGT